MLILLAVSHVIVMLDIVAFCCVQVSIRIFDLNITFKEQFSFGWYLTVKVQNRLCLSRLCKWKSMFILFYSLLVVPTLVGSKWRTE